MIYVFNPEHEMALLHASKYYQPPDRIVKMRNDLAFLPAWYASPQDYVLTETGLSPDFLASVEPLRPLAKPLTGNDLFGKRELRNQEISLWGISLQSIYYSERLSKQYGYQWKIPEWKEEYRLLGHRSLSQKVLSVLMDNLPEIEKEILPRFFYHIEEVEEYLLQCKNKQLAKASYSSSGRGLVWLPAGNPDRTEKQLLCGILKRQSQVSIEKALDKQLDFSMHFEITSAGAARFVGYSVFRTNAKGAYEKSLPAKQHELEKQITSFIDTKLLNRVKNTLIRILPEMYFPHYAGNLGVDMMIYRSGDQYKLHPCVEINMRKSMGYLAIRLFDNYIHALSHGELVVDYHPDPQVLFQKHCELQSKYPPVIENGLIKSGYLSLCPVTETTRFRAYLSAFGSSAAGAY